MIIFLQMRKLSLREIGQVAQVAWLWPRWHSSPNLAATNAQVPHEQAGGGNISDGWPGWPTAVFGLAGSVWNCSLIGWQHLRIERFHLKTLCPHFSKQRWMTWPPRATPGHPITRQHGRAAAVAQASALCFLRNPSPAHLSHFQNPWGRNLSSGSPLVHSGHREGPGDPGKARTHSRLGMGPPVSTAGMVKQTPRVGGVGRHAL